MYNLDALAPTKDSRTRFLFKLARLLGFALSMLPAAGSDSGVGALDHPRRLYTPGPWKALEMVSESQFNFLRT
jgi:hypothetical protein